MLRSLFISGCVGVMLLVSGTVHATVVSRTADFENIQPGEDPQQGWTFGVGPQNEGIEDINGNHVLHGNIDNWGVTIRSKDDGTNPWVGNKNYRTEGVVGFQFTVAGTADFNTARQLTIFLLSDNGTPHDFSDDFGYYHTIDQWYFFNGRPRTYSFPIPSQAQGKNPPAGWFPYSVNGQFPKDFSWDSVIADVDMLNVGLWKPDYFYSFQNHDMRIDNLRIFVNTKFRQ